MRILVLGADGFIGKNVCQALETHHEVYRATKQNAGLEGYVSVDIVSKPQLVELFTSLTPDAIVNCAGIVDPKADASLNEIFTKNMLEAVVEAQIAPKRIVVIGSAGEYGVVGFENLPVGENAPLAPTSDYARSKARETVFARQFAKQHGLSLVVARLFNPLGTPMQPKFLISSIIAQVDEIRRGARRNIEVSRLDALRDYIDVRDVASAIEILVEAESPLYDVYNIGTGKATSNQELIELVLAQFGIKDKPLFVETSQIIEPIVAVRADIGRICNEFGWKPRFSINDTVKEIMHATSN